MRFGLVALSEVNKILVLLAQTIVLFFSIILLIWASEDTIWEYSPMLTLCQQANHGWSESH